MMRLTDTGRVLIGLTLLAFDADAQVNTPEQAPSPAMWMIYQYQRVLSPSKADTCRMFPSCSEYARQAYDTYPFWKATLMSTDRLNRSDHDAQRYELVNAGGTKKQYDPLPGHPYAPPHPSDATSTAPIHPVDVSLQQMKPGLSPEEQVLDFARYLHLLGKTDLALVEYLRFLRRYKDSPLASSARVSVMHLYHDAHDYRQAVLWAEQEMAAHRISEADIPELLFWTSTAYVRLNNPERARASLPKEELEPHLSERATLLEAYTYAQQENWSYVITILKEYKTVADDPSRADTLIAQSETAMRRRKRSPALAGVLGVVPGLGYLYAGYPESAVSALILNSLLLAASYEAFNDGNKPLGTLLGIVGIGWYAGSIYGSISAADRRNDDDLRDTLIQFNLGFNF